MASAMRTHILEISGRYVPAELEQSLSVEVAGRVPVMLRCRGWNGSLRELGLITERRAVMSRMKGR